MVLLANIVLLILLSCIPQAMHAAPMYIAETAPSQIRGRLISLKEFFIVLGMLVSKPALEFKFHTYVSSSITSHIIFTINIVDYFLYISFLSLFVPNPVIKKLLRIYENYLFL